MARCEKKIQTGTAVEACGRPAAFICRIPSTYTVRGRVQEALEYRCELHVEGQAMRLRESACVREVRT